MRKNVRRKKKNQKYDKECLIKNYKSEKECFIRNQKCEKDMFNKKSDI